MPEFKFACVLSHAQWRAVLIREVAKFNEGHGRH